MCITLNLSVSCLRYVGFLRPLQVKGYAQPEEEKWRKTRYRPARWLNRASMRKNGRLAPSVQSKVHSHLREKRFVESLLPVTAWHVETANFDIHKIVNPYVSGNLLEASVHQVILR